MTLLRWIECSSSEFEQIWLPKFDELRRYIKAAPVSAKASELTTPNKYAYTARARWHLRTIGPASCGQIAKHAGVPEESERYGNALKNLWRQDRVVRWLDPEINKRTGMRTSAYIYAVKEPK